MSRFCRASIECRQSSHLNQYYHPRIMRSEMIKAHASLKNSFVAWHRRRHRIYVVEIKYKLMPIISSRNNISSRHKRHRSRRYGECTFIIFSFASNYGMVSKSRSAALINAEISTIWRRYCSNTRSLCALEANAPTLSRRRLVSGVI